MRTEKTETNIIINAMIIDILTLIIIKIMLTTVKKIIPPKTQLA